MNEVADLLSGASARLGPAQFAERYDTLPEPVRRYLHEAIPDSVSTCSIASVHVVHGGAFRTSPGGRWVAITAEQWHTVAEPGFVWQARFTPLPFVRLDVTDCLVRGKGSGAIKVAGKLPVSTASGPEVDQSACARWLMEAVWFPLAFVGPYIRWESVDTDTACAKLTIRGDVAVTVQFDRATGLPSILECDRYMSRTLRRFRGSCSLFERYGGFRIPTVIRGSWMLPEAEFAYVDFQLRSIAYDGRGA